MSRHDPDEAAAAQAMGCFLGLFVVLIGGLVYAIQEATRYRPQPYAPTAPYHPTQRFRAVDFLPVYRGWEAQIIRWGSLLLAAVFIFLFALLLPRNAVLPQTAASIGSLLGQNFPLAVFATIWMISINGLPILIGLATINIVVWAFNFWRLPPLAKAEFAENIPFFRRYVDVLLLRVSAVIALLVTIPSMLLYAYLVYSSNVQLGLPGFVVLVGILGGGEGLVIWLWWLVRKGIPETQEGQRVGWEKAAAIKQRLLAAEAERLAAIQPTVYKVYAPKSEAEYVIGSKLVQALLKVAPRLTFQIVGTGQSINWRIVDVKHRYDQRVILSHIKSHVPEAVVVPEPESEVSSGSAIPFSFYREHLIFSTSQEYGVPLPPLESLKVFDPLQSLTNRLNTLQDGERVIYSVVVLVASPQARVRSLERFQMGYITSPTRVKPKYEDERDKLEFDEKLVTAKMSSQLYHCYVVVTIESPRKNRLEELRQIISDITLYQLPGHNALVDLVDIEPIKVETVEEQRQMSFEGVLETWALKNEQFWRGTLLILSPDEIAALWHLPNENFTAHKIVWPGKPPPVELTNLTGDAVTLGKVTIPGLSQSVGMLNIDRAYHHYILGKTGMGKSTFLHNLIMQDIVAGNGVAVIDPHGKLIKEILATLPARRDEVVLLECGKTDFPIPLNPFRIPQGLTFDDVRATLLWALLKIYEEIKDHARLEMVLGFTIEALLCDPQATPIDITRLFSDDDYLTHVLELMKRNKHTTTAARLYLQSLEGKSKSKRDEIIDPVINRTGAFLKNRALESMTCHQHGLDFVDLVQKKAIVLIDLSGRSIEGEAGSLAALFLAGFFSASKALGEIPDNAPPRYFVYVDELERVATGAFKELLAQVRKLGLSLILAHQHFSQLPGQVKEAIVGNVGTYTVFEVGHDDARGLASYFEPDIEPDDLIKLGAYRAAMRTRFHGKSLPAFIVNTLPPLPRATKNFDDEIREHTRQTQGMITEEAVRKLIDERYGGGDTDVGTDETEPPTDEPTTPPDVKDFE